MFQFVKKILKLLLRRTEREKFKRESLIKRLQDKAIINNYNINSEKLILFIIDGANYSDGKENISGGLLSIHSIYEESIKLNSIHKAEVLLCTIKGANLFFNFSTFNSKSNIYRYEQLEKIFKKANNIVVHLPEYLTGYFFQLAKNRKITFLTSKNIFHINILNQNIQLMPYPIVICELKKFCTKITQTTAHKNYTSKEIRDKFKIPLHHFSTFISPEKYEYIEYNKKNNIIAFSPDDSSLNDIFINLIKKELPTYQIKVIKNMTYENFKSFISKTKFTFTFGEGLDGYFCETILTGGICFAIYNNKFFTKDYLELSTIYISVEIMLNNIIKHIKNLDDEKSFTLENKKGYNLLTSQYQFLNYQENIKQFYLSNYTLK